MDSAGPPADTVAIVVEDGASCTSNDDFFRRIEARAPGIHRASVGEPARTFVARLSPNGGEGVLGQLRTREVDGSESLRELTGSSCAEVAEALALIAAVTVRGQSPDRDREAEPTSQPVVESDRAPPTVPPAAGASDVRLKLSCGGMASVHTSVMPAPLYGIAAVCELVRDAAGYRPSLALALERTLTARAPTDDAISRSEMSADLTLGRLAISPFALRSGKLELRPSATFELGWIEASGRGAGLAQAGQDKGWWAAAGALAQGVLHVGTWQVELGVGGQAPLTRYTFSFRQQTEVYRMGALGFLGTVSIRVGLL